MFLNMLSDDEKRAFALLAEKLIKADGIVVGREETALAALKAEMGLAAESGDGRSAEELAGVFTSRRSKVVALLELLGLAYADTDFEAGEESLIASVRRSMGLSSDDLDAINGWVRAYVDHVRSALVLMRE